LIESQTRLLKSFKDEEIRCNRRGEDEYFNES
jgi:hypothetical protein